MKTKYYVNKMSVSKGVFEEKLTNKLGIAQDGMFLDSKSDADELIHHMAVTGCAFEIIGDIFEIKI